MKQLIHESKLKISAENKNAISAISGVTKQLGSAEKQIKGFGSGISGTLGAFTSFINPTIALSAALGGAVTTMGFMVKSSINTAETLQKMSQRVGVSVESLSTLRHAAELSGTDIGVFEKAIQRLSRNVDDASRGIGDGKKAFDDLGISVVNVDGSLVNSETIMKNVADKFAVMEDGTKKTALALKIFGRAGADLIPMLNDGSFGLETMQQKARDLGLEISTNTANEAAHLKDEMLNLNRSFDGFANRVAPSVVGALSNILGGFNATIDASGNASNNIEYFFNLRTNAAMSGIIAAFRQEKEAFNEAISLAENQARAKSKDLSSSQLKKIVNEQKMILESLGKLDQDENLKNTIQQKEAQLKIYESLLSGNKEIIKQKQLAESVAEQWKSISKTLSIDIAKVGMNDFDKSLLDIETKVIGLKEKFGEKPLINMFSETMTNSTINAMVSESLNEAYAEQEAYSEQLFELEDESLAHSIEISMQKRDLIYQEMDLKEKQIEEERNLQDRRLGSYQNSFGNMAQASQMFYDLSGKQAKAGFAAYKAFSIAETAISTYRAATSALEPYPVGLGPVFGIPLAVSTVALGLANVARIASMSPGNSGGGGGSYSATSIPSYSTTNNNVSNGSPIYITINSSGDSGNIDWDSIVRDKILGALEKHVNYGGSLKIGAGIRN